MRSLTRLRLLARDGSEYLAGGDAARLEQACSEPSGSHEAMCRTGDRCRTSGGDDARQVFVQYTIEYNRLGDEGHDTSSLKPVYRALLSASSESATVCARDMEAAACGEADGPTPGSPGFQCLSLLSPRDSKNEP